MLTVKMVDTTYEASTGELYLLGFGQGWQALFFERSKWSK